MKHVFVIILLSLVYPGVEAQLPQIYLEDTDNQEVLLSDLKGEHLTLVDFWATWCKPCLIAIPELIKIQNDFKSEGVQIVGVNIDSPRNKAKVKPFSMARGINYPILLDINHELMKELNVVLVPTLIILDSEGNQLYTHEGFNPGDQDQIRKKIQDLLK